MKLRHGLALSSFALLLVSGPSLAADMAAVVCGDIQVSLKEADSMAVKAVTGEENFQKDICDALAKMDPAPLSGPNEVKVMLTDGTEFTAMISPAQ
ncbi:hypothetical protein [Tropicimonas sp. IMCC34043]|uniref:hypothetical protein n=1 Tax=Tropicimonas sp. IMCC34043 TaxID=2248760 RepID=UPI000E25F629|nr:hypothetical protein [Tropicimonas sp. IMCC34043]